MKYFTVFAVENISFTKYKMRSNLSSVMNNWNFFQSSADVFIYSHFSNFHGFIHKLKKKHNIKNSFKQFFMNITYSFICLCVFTDIFVINFFKFYTYETNYKLIFKNNKPIFFWPNFIAKYYKTLHTKYANSIFSTFNFKIMIVF